MGMKFANTFYIVVILCELVNAFSWASQRAFGKARPLKLPEARVFLPVASFKPHSGGRGEISFFQELAF